MFTTERGFADRIVTAVMRVRSWLKNHGPSSTRRCDRQIADSAQARDLPMPPDLQTQLEDLLSAVWALEANWRLDDRIDLAHRLGRLFDHRWSPDRGPHLTRRELP